MHKVKLHQTAFMANRVKWKRCKLQVIVDFSAPPDLAKNTPVWTCQDIQWSIAPERMIWEFPLEHPNFIWENTSKINTMSTRTTNGCRHGWHVVPVDLVPSRANPPGEANMLQLSVLPSIRLHGSIANYRQLSSVAFQGPIPTQAGRPVATAAKHRSRLAPKAQRCYLDPWCSNWRWRMWDDLLVTEPISFCLFIDGSSGEVQHNKTYDNSKRNWFEAPVLSDNQTMKVLDLRWCWYLWLWYVLVRCWWNHVSSLDKFHTIPCVWRAESNPPFDALTNQRADFPVLGFPIFRQHMIMLWKWPKCKWR